MADLTDVALNVSGWVVGGATAVGGILVAYHFQEKSRLKQEDRVGVFEPLRREMTGILDNGDWRNTSGYIVWSRSEVFSDLLKRGALKPPRLMVPAGSRPRFNLRPMQGPGYTAIRVLSAVASDSSANARGILGGLAAPPCRAYSKHPAERQDFHCRVGRDDMA